MSQPLDKILVLDFGGQYNQLIARRVRDLKVYSEVVTFDITPEEILEKNPRGIIFTGGPSSVFDDNAPVCDREVFEMGIPVLGICYGAQLMAHVLGGEVRSASAREYGKTYMNIEERSHLFKNMDPEAVCWMSHTYYIETPPEGFRITAFTKNCPVAAMMNEEKRLYAVQFHPEVEHTPIGKDVLANFVFDICGCSPSWDMNTFIEDQVKEIRQKVKDKKVICALSGGVDSSVAAVLVNKAVGSQLTCIFVDHGLLRKDEEKQVVQVFRDKFGMNLIKVDARERFLRRLEGVEDPEHKRKIIGEEFIRVFEEEANRLGKTDFLVQGTIYPDVIESGNKVAAVIKSHHNVGGLPEDMKLSLIEPLRSLFKDEVREVGRDLGMPEELVWRQPFPGPGLAIRLIGDITREKLDMLKEADAIVREEVKNAGLDREIWQYFAVLLDVKTVGVMGDERTYDHVLAIRAVTSSDGMTADWAKIPYDVLENMSSRIINNVRGINRVVYDITTKPPGTIEWE
ncbi:MAG: GMP synthase [glutamine-hydrolyzing] [Firmicutes bacterium]|nr:GMP synthase [glutamine-hydrolyzing] [Bacillota bacterium]MDI6706145.1 glutamine-hydrolyzing GMP synthase [Bacillota bacterium]